MIDVSGIVRDFLAGEEGATMLEYGFMATLIAVACAFIVGALGTSVSTLFASVPPLFAG